LCAKDETMSDAARFRNSMLPPELDALVQAEMQSGERVLWVGQPNPGRMAKSGCIVSLFGIPFTAFSVFWIAMAAGIGGGMGGGPGGWIALIFPLFGLPFVLVGLALLSAPYWMARKARRTCYAVTNRRAIVFESSWRGTLTVYAYRPDELTKLFRREHADGSGDLVFEEIASVRHSSRGGSRTHITPRGFLAVDDVRAVETLLRKSLLDTGDRGLPEMS